MFRHNFRLLSPDEAGSVIVVDAAPAPADQVVDPALAAAEAAKITARNEKLRAAWYPLKQAWGDGKAYDSDRTDRELAQILCESEAGSTMAIPRGKNAQQVEYRERGINGLKLTLDNFDVAWEAFGKRIKANLENGLFILQNAPRTGFTFGNNVDPSRGVAQYFGVKAAAKETNREMFTS